MKPVCIMLGMSVVDLQRIVALVLYSIVAVWSFRAGCKIRWTYIRATMHTITAISVLWILFTIAVTGAASVVKEEPHLNDLHFSLWLLTFLESATAVGLGLIVWFGQAINDMQARAIASLKEQGFKTDD